MRIKNYTRIERMLKKHVGNDVETEPLKNLVEKILDYRGASPPKSKHGIPLITARNIRGGYWIFQCQSILKKNSMKFGCEEKPPKRVMYFLLLKLLWEIQRCFPLLEDSP